MTEARCISSSPRTTASRSTSRSMPANYWVYCPTVTLSGAAIGRTLSTRTTLAMLTSGPATKSGATYRTEPQRKGCTAYAEFQAGSAQPICCPGIYMRPVEMQPGDHSGRRKPFWGTPPRCMYSPSSLTGHSRDSWRTAVKNPNQQALHYE